MMKTREITKSLIFFSIVILLGVYPFSEAWAVKEILFTGTPGVTGPLADISGPQQQGTEDGIKYANEKGLFGSGVKVKFKWQDSQYKVSVTVPAFNKFIEEGTMLHITYSTGDSDAIKEMAAKAHVPVIDTGYGTSPHFPPGYCFGHATTYHETLAVLGQYWLSEWKKSGKTKPPKLGILTWDNPFGRSYEIAIPYLVELGWEVIPQVQYCATFPTDVTSQLAALNKADADFIVSCLVPMPWSTVLKDAERLGLKNKIKFGCLTGAFADQVIRGAGKASIGAYACLSERLWTETNVTMVREVLEYSKKLRGADYKPGYCYIQSFHSALMAARGTKLAVDSVGLDKLDGKAIKENGLEKIKNWDSGLAPPLTFDKNEREGSRQARVWTFVEGVDPIFGGNITMKCLTPEWLSSPRIVPAEYLTVFPQAWKPKKR